MTDPTRDDEDHRDRIRIELERALANTRSMQAPADRQQLVRLLRQRLDHPMLADRPDPVRQSQEVVYFCTRSTPEAVRLMVDTVAGMENLSNSVLELHRARDEWETYERFSGYEWGLRPLLVMVDIPHLTQLFQRAAKHHPPPWCTDAWRMFVYLESRNTAAGVPPGLIFLALLQREVEPPLSTRIRRRNQHLARVENRTAELNHVGYTIEADIAHPASTAVASATAYLVLQVAPDLEPDDDPDAPQRYRLSLYHQWRTAESWQSEQYGAEQTVALPDLPRAVERAVRELEATLSSAGVLGPVVVEFVLPWELLNADVEWWPADPPTVLATAYPVVVRSLERLQNHWWHRRWRMRWQRLQTAPGTTQVYWSEPRGSNHLDRLDAELHGDERWAALVPSEPPLATGRIGRLEVTAALRAGLPVVIWHRGDCRTDAFREAVDRLTAGGGLAQLPMRVKRLRADAAMLDPEQQADHVGRHLTVLWDDPDRLPEPAGGLGEPVMEATDG